MKAILLSIYLKAKWLPQVYSVEKKLHLFNFQRATYSIFAILVWTGILENGKEK